MILVLLLKDVGDSYKTGEGLYKLCYWIIFYGDFDLFPIEKTGALILVFKLLVS